MNKRIIAAVQSHNIYVVQMKRDILKGCNKLCWQAISTCPAHSALCRTLRRLISALILEKSIQTELQPNVRETNSYQRGILVGENAG